MPEPAATVRLQLERAVERNHSVGSAAILVIANIRAIEIEVSVRLVADFAGGGDNVGNLPVQSRAGSYFTIGQDCVVEPRDSICVPEIVVYAVTGLLHIRPYVKGEVLAHLKLETGSWQHGIKKPFRGDFPANPAAGITGYFRSISTLTPRTSCRLGL